MRLWGRVMSGGLLLMAAALAVVAIAVPETQPEALVVVVLMVTGALFGVPLVVRFFGSLLGDETVLEGGIPGSATIESLQPTRWRYNRRHPIVRFGLVVEADGVYPVEVTQVVDPELLARLAPGAVVGVRVDRRDPRNVVIDWREPIRASGGEAAAGPRASRSPSRRRPWVFVSAIVLVVGVVFLRLGCEERAYEAGGHRVQGVVLEKRYVAESRSTDRTTRSGGRYEVRYRFTTKEGRTLEGRSSVLPRTWRGLQEAGPVVVEYVADAPRTNRIPEQRARSGTWTLLGFALLVVGAGLLVVARRSRPAPAAP